MTPCIDRNLWMLKSMDKDCTLYTHIGKIIQWALLICEHNIRGFDLMWIWISTEADLEAGGPLRPPGQSWKHLPIDSEGLLEASEEHFQFASVAPLCGFHYLRNSGSIWAPGMVLHFSRDLAILQSCIIKKKTQTLKPRYVSPLCRQTHEAPWNMSKLQSGGMFLPTFSIVACKSCSRGRQGWHTWVVGGDGATIHISKGASSIRAGRQMPEQGCFAARR